MATLSVIEINHNDSAAIEANLAMLVSQIPQLLGNGREIVGVPGVKVVATFGSYSGERLYEHWMSFRNAARTHDGPLEPRITDRVRRAVVALDLLIEGTAVGASFGPKTLDVLRQVRDDLDKVNR